MPAGAPIFRNIIPPAIVVLRDDVRCGSLQKITIDSRLIVSRNWWILAGGVICRWTLTHPTGGGNAREITP